MLTIIINNDIWKMPDDESWHIFLIKVAPTESQVVFMRCACNNKSVHCTSSEKLAQEIVQEITKGIMEGKTIINIQTKENLIVETK
jgi:ornithine carbamoyltransferase